MNMQDMETSTIKGRKIISQKKRLKSLSMIFILFCQNAFSAFR